MKTNVTLKLDLLREARVVAAEEGQELAVTSAAWAVRRGPLRVKVSF